jgi:hypothetical protein
LTQFSLCHGIASAASNSTESISAIANIQDYEATILAARKMALKLSRKVNLESAGTSQGPAAEALRLA